MLGKVGGFGGLFALDLRKYRQPVLVSSVDGVGTKLKIAFAMDRHDTIGQDLVNHCVNDIAVLGAEPLFFLDYLGTGKLEPRVFTDIINGFATRLRGEPLRPHRRRDRPDARLLPARRIRRQRHHRRRGGEIPDARRAKTVRPGDAVIGIASSGLHTNGYSLARKIFFEQMKLKPTSHVPELRNTIGDELLKVHVSYGPLVQALMARFNRPGARRQLKALAHITGGGFVDNIPRVLPKNCDVVIRKGSWDMLPIFQLLPPRAACRRPSFTRSSTWASA